MPKHLKTHIISRLDAAISNFVPPSDVSALHSRGVRYFMPEEGIDAFWGAMNTAKEGRRYRKHIIVRRAPEHKGLVQLYTYHFPRHWSAACVANRELIKEAQRLAHAIEHDHSLEALTWRVRFFNHYFTVVKGGAKPEEGMKRYSRFYQYTYVAIYRQLQAERKKAQEPEPVAFEAISMEQPFRLKRQTFQTASNTLLDVFAKPEDRFEPPNKAFWKSNLPPPI
jgi:hypothetical protein